MNIEQKFTLAATACESKDFGKAKSLLQEIIKEAPKSSEPYRLLGQIAYEEGDNDTSK